MDEPLIDCANGLKDALFHVFAALGKLPARMGAALDMPPGEFMTLHRIGLHGPPWECPVSDLSVGTHVSMSAISQSLASLERKGYLTRSVSEQDRRRITVSLTPQGQDCARVVNQWMKWMMRRTIERYGEAEMWALIEQARRLIGVMERLHHEIANEIHAKGEMRP